MGEIIAHWRNYFGDEGQMKLEVIKSNAENLSSSSKSTKQDAKRDLEVQLVDNVRLTLEKPQLVKFRLDNMTKNYMKL